MLIGSSIVILFTWILQAALKDNLSGKVYRILWITALIRLWVPVSIPVSIIEVTVFPTQPGSRISNTEGLQNHSSNFIPVYHLLIACIIISIILTCRFIFLYIKEYRRLANSLQTKEEGRDYRRIIKKVTKRRLRIAESDQINSPIIFAIFRPVIVVPKNLAISDRESLTYILYHEATHAKHWDNFWKFLANVSTCIYWFNPLIWLLKNHMSFDIEKSCDEDVLKIAGGDHRYKYAASILNLLENSKAITIMAQNFSSRKQIYERMVAIMKYKKMKISGLILSAAICSMGVATFFLPQVAAAQQLVNTSLPIADSEIQTSSIGSDNSLALNTGQTQGNVANTTANIIIPSAEEIMSNEAYPVNANGQTYGPNTDLTGISIPEPDLMLAEGEGGVIGYVCITPPLSNPDQGPAYNEKMEECDPYIPLYMQDGETIIGSFHSSCS